jgi:hypothetical protein
MSQRSLPRRLLVGATSGALLLGVVGAIPLLSPASAACTPTYTDPAGDSGATVQGSTEPTGKTADDDLDILDVTHTVDGAVFSTVLHLKALNATGPNFAFTDRFATLFTVNGKAVEIDGDRDYSLPSGEVDHTKLVVAGTTTTVAVKLVADVKASTITLQIAEPAFETALGGSLTGKPFTAMSSKADEILPAFDSGLVVTFDTATAPASAAYAYGASCGGGTPGPTDSASPGGGSPSPTATASPTPPAGGGPSALYDQPRKGCVTYTDPTGDADPSGTGLDNESSLDVTQVNLKSPADGLQVYVKVADLSSGLFPVFSGSTYDVALTIGGVAIVVSTDDTGKASATVGGKASTDLVPTAKLDTKNSNIVVTLPMAGLAKVGAAVVTGTAITGTAITTTAQSPFGGFKADTAAGSTAAQKTYAYGDNTCFLPPAGTLSIDADAKGQYSDRTTMFLTFDDVDASPVEGAKVTAVLTGGHPVSAVTDSDGIAELTLPITEAAGTKVLTASFLGNADAGATTATAKFVVVAEKAVLKAVGIRGGASATLLDDDKHPIAGRVVTFTVGSKKYAVKTNAKGVAVLTHLAMGTAVKVGFAGVKGYYLATPTYTVRAS